MFFPPSYVFLRRNHQLLTAVTSDNVLYPWQWPQQSTMMDGGFSERWKGINGAVSMVQLQLFLSVCMYLSQILFICSLSSDKIMNLSNCPWKIFTWRTSLSSMEWGVFIFARRKKRWIPAEKVCSLTLDLTLAVTIPLAVTVQLPLVSTRSLTPSKSLYTKLIMSCIVTACRTSAPVNFDSICISSIWHHHIMKLRAICFPGHTITFDLNPVLNTTSLLLYHFDQVFTSRITNGFELNTYGTVTGHNS